MVETDIDLARKYAYEKHGEQKYGNKPYSYHLDGVVKNIKKFFPVVFNDNYDFHIRSCVVGWLHDIIEDTDADVDEISIHFGKVVANDVQILTRIDCSHYGDAAEENPSALALG